MNKASEEKRRMASMSLEGLVREYSDLTQQYHELGTTRRRLRGEMTRRLSDAKEAVVWIDGMRLRLKLQRNINYKRLNDLLNLLPYAVLTHLYTPPLANDQRGQWDINELESMIADEELTDPRVLRCVEEAITYQGVDVSVVHGAVLKNQRRSERSNPRRRQALHRRSDRMRIMQRGDR